MLTGVLGFILEKKGFKLPDQLAPVAWALLIGGIGFVGVEAWLRDKTLNNEVTWTMAIAVGLGQVVAGDLPRRVTFRHHHPALPAAGTGAARGHGILLHRRHSRPCWQRAG